MTPKEVTELMEAYHNIYEMEKRRDHEVSMIRAQLHSISDSCEKLTKHMSGKEEMDVEAWVQAKITRAEEDLHAAANYIDSGESVAEEAELDEAVDIYNIILSHLLDEGYAKSLDQAEVIISNMSEDWKSAIVRTATNATHNVGDQVGKAIARHKRAMINLESMPLEKTLKQRSRLSARTAQAE